MDSGWAGGQEGTLDQYAVWRTGWTSDPASRALSLKVHAGSWTGGEEPRPRRLRGSGWAGATQATWTSTLCMGLVGDVRQPVCCAENWLDERPSISSIVPPGECRGLDRRRGAKTALTGGLRMGRCRAGNLDQYSV